MKFHKFASLIFSLILVEESNCVPINDFKEVIADLQTIHPKRSVFEENGIENMATKNNVDIPKDTFNYHELNKNHNLNRQKRYTVMYTKWNTTSLTYRFDHKNKKPFVDEEDNIRRLIREAFNAWEKYSVLKFTELNEGTADIMISFEEPEHYHIDHFVILNRAMGHAFFPGSGLGGDIHLNQLKDWDFEGSNSITPEDKKVSLLTILLNFIGKSLGLGASYDEGSLMYGFYTKTFSTLTEDEINGIQHIYGVPPNSKYKPANKNKTEEEDTPV